MVSRIRAYLRNPVSIGALLIAAVAFLGSTALLLMDLFEEHENPYRGILTFFVLPGILMGSLGMAAFGAWLEARRRKAMGAAGIDAGSPRRRGRVFGYSVLGVLLIFLVLSVAGSYHAYEFTDSTAFCGKLCHAVMEPEYVTYLNSPHARVKCVECHVGSGAQWYVKAKLSGLYQVYATLTDKYPRPIPTPIKDLRPSEDTCEQCHWPEKFWGAQLAQLQHYGYDFANTRREVLMVVKTGGGGSAHGAVEGIHWHVNVANEVEYVHRDDKRLDIPWFRVQQADGTYVEYRDTEKPLSAAELAKLPWRRMDCMDCHNRPTHIYRSPDALVDQLLARERIDAGVLHLKTEAVAVLAREYAGKEEAKAGIAEGLLAAYREKHPEVLASKEKEIRHAAEALYGVYTQNFFPHMRASWKAYPSHIGHREFPGCFRCHGGRHATAEGKVLRADCDLCHTFAVRAENAVSFHQVPSHLAYLHPWKSGHDKVGCWNCHAGDKPPYHGCVECHKPAPADAPMRFACAVCHQPMTGPEFKPASGCVRCHEVAESEFHDEDAHRDCIDCHRPHAWKVALPAACIKCHGDFLKDHNVGENCNSCHELDGVDSVLMPAK